MIITLFIGSEEWADDYNVWECMSMQVYTGVEVSAGSGCAKCSEGRAQETVERHKSHWVKGSFPKLRKS